MPHGMETLQRKVIDIIGAFADGAGPVHEGVVEAVADFLRLFIQNFLRHFFPGEAEVADHGHKAQSNRPARGKMQRAVKTIAVVGVKPLGNWFVGEVAGGDDVSGRGSKKLSNPATFRKMRFNKSAVFPVQFAERVKGLDHAGALGPAASGAGREGKNAHLPRRQRVGAKLRDPRIGRLHGVNHIAMADIFDDSVGGEAILRQTQPAIF